MNVKKLFLFLLVGLSLIPSSNKAWDINPFYIASAIACAASVYLAYPCVSAFLSKNNPDALAKVVISNNLNQISRLIKFGANVNAVDKYGNTPLYYAARYGKLSVIKLLLENKAKINTIDRYGNTPLHYAANYDPARATKILLEKGNSVCVVDEGRWLLLNSFAKHDELGTIKLLTTVPIVFDNNFKNNKKLFVDINDFSSDYAEKTFNEINSLIEQFVGFNSDSIELIISYVLPTDYLIESNDVNNFNSISKKKLNCVENICEQYNTNPMEAISFFKYKHVKAFTKQCYKETNKNTFLSKLFLNELRKQYLFNLQRYVSIKNNNNKTAVDMAAGNDEIVGYLEKIQNIEIYDDLDAEIKKQIEVDCQRSIGC